MSPKQVFISMASLYQSLKTTFRYLSVNASNFNALNALATLLMHIKELKYFKFICLLYKWSLPVDMLVLLFN